ncbi:MAG TPA: multicopper oxidase domain-containing protein [Gemmatimonadales bacterium]|nr:multicopper oxidase domain-containing protein [Gemmatimonadales bacterium]
MRRAHLGSVLGVIAPVFMVASHSLRRDHPVSHTHTYYIAADEVTWKYVPTGTNQVAGRPFDAVERRFVEAGPSSVGGTALKAVYREYTDSSFAVLRPRPQAWEHLGLLGPVLRAQVGDTIRVVFRNNVRFPVSMHPHGVFYDKDSEGAPYAGKTGAADTARGVVATGRTHVYLWPVPERAGPGAGDPSSIIWMYHSHVHEEQDLSSGLLGPIIVTARGKVKPDGTPVGVDREFIVAFDEIDENSSRLLTQNIAMYMQRPDSVRVDTSFGIPSVRGQGNQYNFKETLNGYLYGNGPMPTMRVGEHVRWYLMSGTGFEFHSPHWHGNTVQIGGMRTDVAALLPMGMVVADMVPDNPGVWLFHCHVSNHLRMGMQMRYEVLP